MNFDVFVDCVLRTLDSSDGVCESVDKMSHRAMNDVSPEPFALEDYVWMNWDASESVCVCARKCASQSAESSRALLR